MKKKQQSVRWHAWLFNAIEEWGKRNGPKSFSDSVNYLLTCELERRGYKPEFFEPGIYDRIKFKNMLKHMPPEMKKRVETENMGYRQVMEEFNITINFAVQKAEKDDTKYLQIPSIEEEYGMDQDREVQKQPPEGATMPLEAPQGGKTGVNPVHKKRRV